MDVFVDQKIALSDDTGEWTMGGLMEGVSSKRRIQKARIAALLVASALVAAACGTSEAPQTTPAETEAGPAPTVAAPIRITAAQTQLVPALDPLNVFSADAIGLFGNIFDALVYTEPNGTLRPHIAVSWESSDSQNWVVTLRDDVTFSNGALLTAEDVRFTYDDVIQRAESPFRGVLGSIASVEVVDATTLKFALKSPRADFPRLLNYMSIVPKAAYVAAGGKFGLDPVGSGPYTVVAFVPDLNLELRAREDYWGGAPAVKEAQVLVTPDVQSALLALKAGDADFIAQVPNTAISDLENTPEITVERFNTNRFSYITLNLTNPVLADIKLRKAIDIGFNREDIAALSSGMDVPTGQAGTPSVGGWDPTVPPTPYDMERARALVADSSYDGSTIMFEFPTRRWPEIEDTAAIIAAQLGAIGINVELASEPNSTWLPKYFDAVNQFPGMHFSSTGPGSIDIGATITAFFGSPRDAWMDPYAVDLARRQGAESDPEKRRAIIRQLRDHNADYAANIWVTYQQGAGAYRNTTVTADLRLDSAVRFAELTPVN